VHSNNSTKNKNKKQKSEKKKSTKNLDNKDKAIKSENKSKSNEESAEANREEKVVLKRKKSLLFFIPDVLDRFINNKKTIDMIGKPVFMEDNGEKIGVISDLRHDNGVLKYGIKNIKTDAELFYPADQFSEYNKALIFTPTWLNKAEEVINQLEFKGKVSPEITNLLADEEINEEMLNLFNEEYQDFKDYIIEAKSIKKTLNKQINFLENRRNNLNDELIKFVKERLIEDIDRKTFSEKVTNLRNQVKILDVNIDKARNLLKRLQKSPFGKIYGDDKDVFEKEQEPVFDAGKIDYLDDYKIKMENKVLPEIKTDTPENKFVEEVKKQKTEKIKTKKEEFNDKILDDKLVEDFKKEKIKNNKQLTDFENNIKDIKQLAKKLSKQESEIKHLHDELEKSINKK